MKVDPRFLKEEGTEVFLGNELIVKGLLETEGGTHLWTGYPGSPISGFFDCVEAIQEIPKQYGISAVLANNEALSAAMVNGSQMHGLRAMCVMKSVGLHVERLDAGAGRLALSLQAHLHAGAGAQHEPGDEGLGRTRVQIVARERALYWLPRHDEPSRRRRLGAGAAQPFPAREYA